MRDDPSSQYMRRKFGLPENFRVYQWEVVGNDKVRMKGALVRPLTEYDVPMRHRDFDWLRPLTGKKQATISRLQYDAFFERKKEREAAQ